MAEKGRTFEGHIFENASGRVEKMLPRGPYANQPDGLTCKCGSTFAALLTIRGTSRLTIFGRKVSGDWRRSISFVDKPLYLLVPEPNRDHGTLFDSNVPLSKAEPAS